MFPPFALYISPLLSQPARALSSCSLTTGEDVLVPGWQMAPGQGMEHSLGPWGWPLSQSPVKFYCQGHLCWCRLSERAQMLLYRGGAHSNCPMGNLPVPGALHNEQFLLIP